MTLRRSWTLPGLALVLALLVGGPIGTSKAQEAGQPPAGDESAPAEPQKKAGTPKSRQTKAAEARAEQEAQDAGKPADGAETKDGAVEPQKGKARLERAVLGGGCFWCLEAVFERVPGVKNVVSGYAGGTHPRPTYEEVCNGDTGHAEVVLIEFDPLVVSFEDLLQIFFATHDPTTLNRQGPDFGTQYRSIILYQNEAQRQGAQKVYQELTQARAFGSPIVTELVPLKKFFPAEKYHQDYFRKHPNEPYCQAQIVPKLMKLRAKLNAGK